MTRQRGRHRRPKPPKRRIPDCAHPKDLRETWIWCPVHGDHVDAKVEGPYKCKEAPNGCQKETEVYEKCRRCYAKVSTKFP